MKQKQIKKIYYESGEALCWVKFEERGCPITKDDAEKDYFLSEKDILGLNIVKEKFREMLEELKGHMHLAIDEKGKYRDWTLGYSKAIDDHNSKIDKLINDL